MGSKSFRYEVLVCPSTTSSSAFKEQQHQQSTSSPLSTDNATMFETEVQRFTCDRENMQQYWIPEGFRPILIRRTYLTDSLVATSNNNNSGHLLNGNVIHQLRSRMLNNNDNNINDIELRRRRINVNNNNLNNKNSTSINGGGITKKRRRNNINNNNNVNANRHTVLGQSPPTVNINHLINRQRIKERISALRNSAVSISSSSTLKNLNNPSDRSPSIIIGEMWKDEPENIKKHYERLAIRKKIAQALAFEQKFSTSPSSFSGKSNVHVRSTTTTSTSRHNHVNLPICPTTGSSYRFPVHSNVVEGVTTNGSSSSFDRQNVDNSVNFSPSSSPIISNDSSRQTSDWMTRSDNDSYYDENDENSGEVDNNSTIITSA